MFKWMFGHRRRPRLDVAWMSECGKVRSENQDSFFVDPRGSVFCVADGMGGADGGGIASKMVCDRMSAAAAGVRGFADLMKRSSDAITNANREIREYAAVRSWRQMGTTIAALFVNPETGSEAVIAHIGDSRVYRLRKGLLESLTHDHTVAGELGRRSCAKNLAEELARRAGPLSHVLTRAIGIDDVVIADWRKIEIIPGDTLMICSDGVYDMAEYAGIHAALSQGATASDAAKLLADTVEAAGSADNYTAIIIKTGEAI